MYIMDDYIITRVHSSFSLVENRDLLEDRRTANAISVTSQSQPLQYYQQPIRACHDHVKWRAKVFSSHYKTYFGKINYFHFFII